MGNRAPFLLRLKPRRECVVQGSEGASGDAGHGTAAELKTVQGRCRSETPVLIWPLPLVANRVQEVLKQGA